MQRRSPTLVLPLAAALALTGCVSSKNWTTGRAPDDRLIKSKVEQALQEEPVYKFTDVRVSTCNGVVQLSGWANSEAQKVRAAQVAGTVGDVREVVNNIALKLTATAYPVPPRGDTNNPLGEVDALVKTPQNRR